MFSALLGTWDFEFCSFYLLSICHESHDKHYSPLWNRAEKTVLQCDLILKKPKVTNIFVFHLFTFPLLFPVEIHTIGNPNCKTSRISKTYVGNFWYKDYLRGMVGYNCSWNIFQPRSQSVQLTTGPFNYISWSSMMDKVPCDYQNIIKGNKQASSCHQELCNLERMLKLRSFDGQHFFFLTSRK